MESHLDSCCLGWMENHRRRRASSLIRLISTNSERDLNWSSRSNCVIFGCDLIAPLWEYIGIAPKCRPFQPAAIRVHFLGDSDVTTSHWPVAAMSRSANATWPIAVRRAPLRSKWLWRVVPPTPNLAPAPVSGSEVGRVFRDARCIIAFEQESPVEEWDQGVAGTAASSLRRCRFSRFTRYKWDLSLLPSAFVIECRPRYPFG